VSETAVPKVSLLEMNGHGWLRELGVLEAAGEGDCQALAQALLRTFPNLDGISLRAIAFPPAEPLFDAARPGFSRIS
jgi:hypothetical protein